MLVRASAVAERLRSSLFFVPMGFVVLALALAVVGLEVDTWLTESDATLPSGLTSTVDSARAVLTTVAGATITVAGIAFSVSLLLIQQASSQYSPRVIHGFFRDPFNKRVMGVVVGTFTYCLVVLRSVRGPLEQDGSPVIPNLSVAVAVALGVVSILSIIAFISHSAHAMDVSKILQDVSDGASERAAQLWSEPDSEAAEATDDDEVDPASGLRIDLADSGWIQQIDFEGMAAAAGPGAVVHLDVAVGRYAVPGTPLGTIVPAPDDEDRATDRIRRSLVVGDSRTAQQDVGYGVRQLADVALKALSPGVNDPTTAQDALFHLGGVVRELLRRDPPPRRRTLADDCVIVVREDLTHDDVVALAFDEIRLAAVGMPTVCIYLLEVLALLTESLRDRPDQVVAPLRAQAELVRAGAGAADLLPHDRRRIEDAFDARFA